MRSALAATVSLLAAACATPQAAAPEPAQQLDASAMLRAAADAEAKQMAAMDQARTAAKAECDLVATHPVTWDEERQVGWRLALLSMERRHFALADGSQTAAVPAVPTPLPAGNENELTRYVQRIGARVAARAPRAVLEWTFAVEDAATTRP